VPPAPVLTDRTDLLAVPPGRLWEVLEDVDGYPSFWPWLRSFDGRRLATGERWRGVIDVAGPLRLAVTITLTEVVAPRCVAARLDGDLSGTARIELADAGLHLTASLVPERRALRLLTRLARPLAQASHDRVIARAIAQLTAHLSP
jgi:uncharacterized protein YndB with AHSA1/START domain